MSSRMHTPHTTCPSCHEEVFLDELVGGRCPLCGYSLDEDEGVCGEFDETLERADLGWMIFNYFLFRRFDSLGVNPLQIMQLLSRYEDVCNCNPAAMGRLQFELEVPMNLFDRLRPKKCSRCGRLFVMGGKKVIAGDLSEPVFPTTYICRNC
ncbi:hypothetical protein ABH15_03555 [Methanoculleus taiwanensis]|uniref:Uncharacterized protein n=1 Tax=Methanoculleus taiwanensis TaxID=1550565 RepID=A0A498H2N7_9EURY|nr:hypothetical protein [Methanoculleus taiwanensis]RXE57202.1 hypothetical protein ABH15_03555 [Methanoculleus taiwanensis]